jgi:hypothetical protein
LKRFASLNLICPKGQAEIEPSQILRITFEEIKMRTLRFNREAPEEAST